MARKERGRTKLPARRTKKLMVRAESTGAARAAASRSRATDGIPEARIDKGGGAVSVQITFGHAQHASYTIQLFDPAGSTELAREAGVNTDTEPDRFDLTLTPAQLHRHLVQWSGAVDAFSGGPGQRYSVLSLSAGGTRGGPANEQRGGFVLSSFKWALSREPAVRLQ
jgi:hypothetical protein